MGKMRGSAEVQHSIKVRGLNLHQKGWKNRMIAEALGVTVRAVQQWVRQYTLLGSETLTMKPRGRVRRERLLSVEQQARVRVLISRCFPNELKLPYLLWSRQAVQALVQQEFGIQIAIRTLGDYLQAWGFTAQRPVARAYEKQPEAVQEWLEKTYPDIRRRARQEQAEIHWGDQSRCQNQPGYHRGYAPCGQTPVVRKSGSRRGLEINLMSSITNKGKLRFMLYEGTLDSARLLEFLRRLCKDAKRKIFLILDNLRVHHSVKVRRWVEAHADRLEVFHLPSYSPELNPDEYMNQDLKRHVHQRGMPRTPQEAVGNVRSFLRTVQHDAAHVRAYFGAEPVRYAAR